MQDLFEYLPIIDLFHCFYYLNQRFRLLVQYKLTQQAHLRVDFSNLSLREFDFIRSQVNPKKVETLTVGNWDMNRIDEACSSGQISLFLYHYNLSQFSSLTSLRIINLEDSNQLIILLKQLPEKQLKHLYIRFRSYSQKNLDLCLPFMDTIESAILDQVTIIESSKLSDMSFSQLKYLSINNIFTIFLLLLLRKMSRLECLNVKFISHAGDFDATFIKLVNYQLIFLTRLHMESYEIT